MKMILSTYANLFFLFVLVSSAAADDSTIEHVPIVSNGRWLLKNYMVSFPNQVIDDNLNKVFSIDRIKTNGTLHIALSFIADTEIQFVNFDPLIEFSVNTKEGEILRSNMRVFNHYFRMRKQGESLWPSDDEWLCAFDFGSEHQNKAIAFSVDSPAKTKRVKCSLIIENPKENIEVSIQCLSCNTNVPLTAAIEITSSWK